MSEREVVLRIDDLRVDTGGGAPIVEEVSLELRRGEILGLVGESGCGKTTTALSLFGYTQAGARIRDARVTAFGKAGLGVRELRGLRGRMISYVPQNAGTALNPALRVSATLDDMLVEHGLPVRAEVRNEVLRKVGLPATRDFQRAYPHQLSGGQQQRVVTAVALVCEPPVIVLDEPTTALDVVTQAHLLEELLRLRESEGAAMLYVTHDLAVVAQIADRIAVMYAGRIVEEGPTEAILTRPLHPYTRGLIGSIPDHARPRKLAPMGGVVAAVGERPPGCPFAPRCPLRVPDCEAAVPSLENVVETHKVRCIRWPVTKDEPIHFHDAAVRAPAAESPPVLEVERLRAEHRRGHHAIVAAKDVSFAVRRSECVALVGESGSGKTTVARVVAGLHPAAAGALRFDGAPLPDRARRRSLDGRRRIQIIFQNPAEALNPRHTVRAAVERPLRTLLRVSRREASAEVAALLEKVRLPAQVGDRYPAELSGGERQRVAIARALAPKPDVLICDEITSALDVSVQAAVLELLAELRSELGLSMLFITHDLGVVAALADRVLVLEAGQICEEGDVAKVLTRPEHPYTQRLLAAAPTLAARRPGAV